MILSVLYGCGTWSLSFNEKQTENVREQGTNGIFGPTRNKVTERWRKLHNELRDLYYYNDQVEITWAVHVARMGGSETRLGHCG
jgi:hypothetical protein